jgi:RHS repeat-associated protein
MKNRSLFCVGTLAFGLWVASCCNAYGQGCQGYFAPDRIEILGTSLGSDNIHISNAQPLPDIEWIPYSTNYHCGAAFVLDGGSFIMPVINSFDPSGCPQTDQLTFQPGWLNDGCKHTLTMRLYLRVNDSCQSTNPLPFVESNGIALWIDDPNTSEHETLISCSGGAPSCNDPSIGRPVSLATGRMHHAMVDLRIDGPLPIEFSRRYDSGLTDNGPVGYGWQHSYNMSLVELTNPNRRTLIDRNMRRISFNRAGTASGIPLWAPDSINHLTLTEGPVGTEPRWRVKNKNKTEWDFDVQGRLTKIVNRNGNSNTLVYDAPNSTVTITDSFGRSMTLTGSPHINTVTAGSRTVTYTYSGDDLTRVDFPDGSNVSYEYASHRMTFARDTLDHVIEAHEYDPSAPFRVHHTESDAGNYSYDLVYNANPTTTTVTNGRDVSTEFTIDSAKGVATDRTGGPGCSSCGDAGNRTQKEYDSHYNVINSIDGENTITHMTYDAQGNMLTRAEAYNPIPNPPTASRTTTYTYEPNFNLLKKISVPTVATGSLNDGCPSVRQNKTVEMDHDSHGNVLSELTKGCDGDDFISSLTSYTYDSHGQVLTIDGPRIDGDVTTYEYYADDDADVNKRGRLKRITNALDQQTNIASHDTARAPYDLFGNVRSVIDANDVETQYEYDGKDRVLEMRIKGPSLNKDIATQYHYDTVGNLDRTRSPMCVWTGAGCAFSFEYVYDTVNRLKEIHDAFGNKVVYMYDVEGNLTREDYRDSAGIIQKFTNFDYDEFNRIARVNFNNPPKPPQVNFPIGYQYQYFDDGNVQSEEDPLGHLTTFAYDGLKRRITQTQTVGNDNLTTTYGYDLHDNFASVQDPRGLVTSYTSNDMGWRRKTVSPDTGTTIYDYDDAGNLVGTFDANEIQVTRAYDTLNRPTTISYPNSALNVTNSYDSTSVTLGIGRRTGVTDPSGVSTFYYDRRGLLTSEQKTMGGLTYSSSYGRDKNGNLTEIRFPTSDGAVRQAKVNYGFDSADRVNLVTTQVNGVTSTIASGFQYKPFGPRTQLTFGNGLVDARSFDSRYRLGTWTLGSPPYLLNYTHTFDDDSNLLMRSDGVDSYYNRTFAYDEIHRLTNAAGWWCTEPTCAVCPGNKTYTYDNNGNRTCKGEQGQITNYSYPSNSNKLASSAGDEPASYSYDADGNVTGYGAHTYQYSQANRLATVNNGAIATYTYDGSNRRAIKSALGTTTYYFYDPMGRLMTELVPGVAGGTTEGKDYLYLDDAPIARLDWSVTEQTLGDVLETYKSSSNAHLDWTAYDPGGSSYTYVVRRKEMVDPDDKTFNGAAPIATVTGPLKVYDDPLLTNLTHYDYVVFKTVAANALFYYHTDHLGTPIAMTEGSPVFVWRGEPRPFGDMQNPLFPNNLRFPGQYFDAETGLHQNWFRDYAPKTGRYAEADPIGLDGGVNPYVYGSADPINSIDPMGLEDQCVYPKPDCKAAAAECVAQCKYWIERSKTGYWDFINCFNDCMKDAGCERNHDPWPKRPPLWLPLPRLMLPAPPPEPVPVPALPPIVPRLVPVLPLLPIFSPCIYLPELCPNAPPLGLS